MDWKGLDTFAKDPFGKRLGLIVDLKLFHFAFENRTLFKENFLLLWLLEALSFDKERRRYQSLCLTLYEIFSIVHYPFLGAETFS